MRDYRIFENFKSQKEFIDTFISYSLGREIEKKHKSYIGPISAREVRHFSHILNDIELKQALEQKIIDYETVDSRNNSPVQPSSIDVSIVGPTIYKLKKETEILPGHNQKVEECLDYLVGIGEAQKIPFNQYHLIEDDSPICVRLNVRANLPEGYVIHASPKSTMGRIFLDTRVIADYNNKFNIIDSTNRETQLWAKTTSQAFKVGIYEGLPLTQILVSRNGLNRLNTRELMALYEDNKWVIHKENNGAQVPIKPSTWENLYLSLDVSPEGNPNGVAGWRAKQTSEIINLEDAFRNWNSQRKATYRTDKFWTPIETGEHFLFEAGQCYLNKTHEIVHLQPWLNAVLAQHSALCLDGYIHFAGFFDPDWLGKIVLEIKPEETKKIRGIQPVGLMDVFFNFVAELGYRSVPGQAYGNQNGIALAKFFSQDGN